MEMLKLVTALTMITHIPYFDEVVKKDVRNRDNCDWQRVFGEDKSTY